MCKRNKSQQKTLKICAIYLAVLETTASSFRTSHALRPALSQHSFEHEEEIKIKTLQASHNLQTTKGFQVSWVYAVETDFPSVPL